MLAHTRINIEKTEPCPDVSYSLHKVGYISFSLPFFKGEGEISPSFDSVDEFYEALQKVGNLLKRLVAKSSRPKMENFLMVKRISPSKELFFINVTDYTSAYIAIETQPMLCEAQSARMTMEDLKIISSDSFIKDFEENSFKNRKTEEFKLSHRADADMVTSHYFDFCDIIVEGIRFCTIEKSVYQKFCDIRKETPEKAIARFIGGRDIRSLGQDIYKACGITINAYIAAQIYEISNLAEFD